MTAGSDERRFIRRGRCPLERCRLWVRMRVGGEGGEVELEEEKEVERAWRVSWEGEMGSMVVGVEMEIWERCLRRASCWEWRRRYFWSARPRSASLGLGLVLIDIYAVCVCWVVCVGKYQGGIVMVCCNDWYGEVYL